VVIFIRQHIRRTDYIARMGGDEFIILFPETEQKAAHIIMDNLRAGMSGGMREHAWQITFSIGVMTTNSHPETLDELIASVDRLMYDVKDHGKNAIKYA